MKKILFSSVLSFFILLPGIATASPTVEITSPNGGQAFTVGDTVEITWESTSVDKVTIMYVTGSSNFIETNIPNEGSYNWTVDIGNLSAGDKKDVRISIIAYETGVGSAQDTSDETFVVESDEEPPSLEDSEVGSTDWFNAGGVLPTPDTQWVLDVTDTTAELYGKVYPNGASAEVWFSVSTAPNNPKDYKVPGPVSVSGSASVVEHKAVVTGLQPDTKYLWSLIAGNESGTVLGKSYEFKTKEVNDIYHEEEVEVEITDEDVDEVSPEPVLYTTPQNEDQVSRDELLNKQIEILLQIISLLQAQLESMQAAQ